jgi:uncharacterized membrane protein
MTFTEVMDRIAQGFEAFGVAVLICGLVWSFILADRVRRARGGQSGYRALRNAFGGALLLGLEILVAADLIRTVAVSPTLESVAVLGLIVVIRTFLSFSLQIEIEGVVPWKRALTGGVSAVAHAQTSSTGRPEGRGSER